MKIIIGALLFTLAVFLNSIDLGLSVIKQRPEFHVPLPSDGFQLHERMPNVYFYINQYGDVVRITARTMPNELKENDLFILGVKINGGVYPLLDKNRRQVIVFEHNGQNYFMGPELWKLYGSVFSGRIPYPNSRFTNNGLPPRSPNLHS